MIETSPRGLRLRLSTRIPAMNRCRLRFAPIVHGRPATRLDGEVLHQRTDAMGTLLSVRVRRVASRGGRAAIEAFLRTHLPEHGLRPEGFREGPGGCVYAMDAASLSSTAPVAPRRRPPRRRRPEQPRPSRSEAPPRRVQAERDPRRNLRRVVDSAPKPPLAAPPEPPKPATLAPSMRRPRPSRERRPPEHAVEDTFGVRMPLALHEEGRFEVGVLYRASLDARRLFVATRSAPPPPGTSLEVLVKVSSMLRDERIFLCGRVDWSTATGDGDVVAVLLTLDERTDTRERDLLADGLRREHMLWGDRDSTRTPAADPTAGFPSRSVIRHLLQAAKSPPRSGTVS
ncbi:MAG: hypothetical protein ACQEXJ_16960 [Myxococcota bacterium]